MSVCSSSNSCVPVMLPGESVFSSTHFSAPLMLPGELIAALAPFQVTADIERSSSDVVIKYCSESTSGRLQVEDVAVGTGLILSESLSDPPPETNDGCLCDDVAETVTRKGVEVEYTRTQYRVFKFLWKHRDQRISTEMLATRCWPNKSCSKKSAGDETRRLNRKSHRIGISFRVRRGIVMMNVAS